MPALNLDLDYFTHPKVMRLAGMLGPYALALPIRLWCHVAKHHWADGVLNGYTDYEVEAAAGWSGEPGHFVAAMLKLNFLEKLENGYKIHDWLDHAGHFKEYKKRAKTAAKKRWRQHATSIALSNAKQGAKQCSGRAGQGPAGEGIEEEKKPARSRKLTDAEFLDALRKNPAYSHLNIDDQLGKMDGWLLTHPGRQKSRQFIVNWLNKIDKPLMAIPGGRVIPPKPPKTDPIGRGAWDLAYGDLIKSMP